MSLRQKILDQKDSRTLTGKQKYALGKFTGLKWYEPESLPMPSVKQASLLVGALMDYINKNKGDINEILDAIQIWFPSFTNPDKIHPNHRSGMPYPRKSNGNGKANENQSSNGNGKASSNGNGKANGNGNGKHNMPQRDAKGKFLPKDCIRRALCTPLAEII